MRGEQGSIPVAAAGVMAVMAMMTLAIGSVGRYVGLRFQAATAADAAALAAAPVTFDQFGALGTPAEEARVFAEANGARLIACHCQVNRSLEPRVVEVVVEGSTRVLMVGEVAVLARSRAEFIPAPWPDGRDLLGHPGIDLSAGAAADLSAGIVDARVVAVLSRLAERHRIRVEVLRSGHAKYVRGTGVVSNHFYGRAVDITAVDGRPVSAEHTGARQLVAWLAESRGSLRPDEVGSPFREFDVLPGFFADADHRRHVHIGYRP